MFLSFRANHSCPFPTLLAKTSALFNSWFLDCQQIEAPETWEKSLRRNQLRDSPRNCHHSPDGWMPSPTLRAVLKRYLKTVFSGSCAIASITSAPSTICRQLKSMYGVKPATIQLLSQILLSQVLLPSVLLETNGK